MFLAYFMKDNLILNSNADNDRFIYIYQQNYFRIYYDKETKVEYITKHDYRSGFCVLVDKDGNPLLYEGE